MRKIIVLLLFACFCTAPVSADHSVIVLLYHNISSDEENPENPYIIPQPGFSEQMAWLYENGFRCLTVSDMFDAGDGN